MTTHATRGHDQPATVHSPDAEADETAVTALGHPADPPDGGPAPLGWRGWLRWCWRQLTSMRTALVLLFGLAVAAVPGSLLPQRDVRPVAVSDWIAANPQLGPVFDRLGLFDTYGSPWFSAVYLLLFASLAGCIVPRVAHYARAVRAAPPRTPSNLTRLPAYAAAPVADPSAALDVAATVLRRQRYRVVRHTNPGRGDSVAAERGYSREAGNLVFHCSLIVILVGVAVGGLFGFRGTAAVPVGQGFRGTAAVPVGQGFANSRTQYDDLATGAWFGENQLAPFSLKVADFRAQFETGPVQRGAARLFELDLDVTDTPGAIPHRETVKVNEPLRLGGSTVHLIGHGYAPVVTVKDGNGDVAFTGPVAFLPQDGNFTSLGVIKVPDGRPERLAFQGYFLPSAVVGDQGPRSVFPDAFNPALFLTAYTGPPKTETGRPESVYTLDTTGLTQLRTDDGADVLRFQLEPGQYKTLPDGRGTISFDGWTRWVNLQVSDTPGTTITLTGLAVGVAGLCLSLFVRPRRIWVRTRPGSDDTTLVEVGGLDRADARTGLTDDVEDLARTLNQPTDPAGKDTS